MKHLIISLALSAFSLATAPAYAWRVGAACDGQCGLIVASAKCKHIKSSAENLQCTLQNGGMQQDTPALCAQAKAVSGCTMKADAGKAKPPSVASGTLTPQQITACSQEIKAKQIESQRWSGNVNDISARLGRFQKDLFEGRCKGHPEAQAYIAGANKMIGYGGNASGGASKPNMAGKVSSVPAGTTLQDRPSKPIPSSASSVSSKTPQSSSSSGKGKAYAGGHKQCIKFSPGKPLSGGKYQWYAYYNGCNITLKVCDNMTGKHWGCGHEIKPGKKSENWNSIANVNRNGGNFFACATEENGKTVHFDKVTHTCFYYN